MSTGSDSGDRVFASRIYQRSPFSPYFPSFAGPLIKTPQQVAWALQGLDANGGPMTNPASGQATRFAFDGDPVSGSGWLDRRNDVRQLVSVEPFRLASGETESLALVWIMASGTGFEDALDNLRLRYDDIVESPGTWDH